MDEVILARHGESQLSVVGTVNGDPAVACALTETGEEQARRLGNVLAGVELDLCVTSEFERTRQTADIALAGRDVPRLVLPELNDVRFGRFEGGTLADYREWAAANEPNAAWGTSRMAASGTSNANRLVASRSVSAGPWRRALRYP